MRTTLPSLLFSLSLTLLGACTRSPTETAELKPGSRPFAFDVAQVGSLEIAKADPKTGDIWTARFEKDGSQWKIHTGPGGEKLVDRRADSGFIAHLLDTLRFVEVVGPAPAGPRESHGLLPPAFALRWAGFELLIGSEGRSGANAATAGRFASISGISDVQVVKGAALQMLEHVSSFSSLRSQTLLAPLAADDIDEIELFAGKKPVFYAQREGDTWTDRAHKPVRKDAAGFLEGLAHARIQEFVDDRELSDRLARGLVSRPLYQASLKDRSGKETRLILAWQVIDGREEAFATASTRPEAAFKIYSATLRSFEAFRK